MRTPTGPFRGSWALRTGLHSRSTLRTTCTRLAHDVYLAREVEPTPAVLARAAALWGGPEAVLTGWSAAAALGARWIPGGADQELSLPHHRAGHPGLVVHQLRLSADELEDVDGVLVTTPVRTAYDLGRRRPLVEAVGAVDQLCALALCGPDQVAAVARAGDRGLAHLHEVLALVDPGAASPKESELRVLLLQAGLPRPRTQVEARGPDGRFLARGDLGWSRWRVLVEYEGAQHRGGQQLTRDIDRYAELDSAGWTVVRVTAEMLARRPDVVIARVVFALRRAGAPV